ncbi:NAD(P)H-dependent flavin oxidoreductase [Jeotgalibacillus proteolyticus]|uniref:Probable nitronate monooxygenase n=1 Tax=Jeotgalibacillus proteolyticus TaxID=2082395 RepID=A0A2S5GH24_9BACL|nr:DUF561 domain-containing protein [Jeotgalibacillus proteolyticus]PPA72276.1 2-nitropropane dioxygenase [Jeotgalibacillus proteolyticus]
MNPLTSMLSISYPIIQGGMGNVSNAELAAAVSEAGGLGMIGAGTMRPEKVEKLIIETKERTQKPFGVNLALTVNPYIQEIIQLILKHKVTTVSLSAGNPAPYLPLFNEHGVTTLCVTASVAHAKKAEKAGADIVIGEGYEAAGINSHLETTTFTLIPQLADAVNVPVVAAGGVGDGRGLAAALALGASGVQLGTRLIATQESGMHENYLSSILSCNDHGTVIVGKSVGRIRRVLPTPYINKVAQKELEGVSLEEYMDLTAEIQHEKGAREGKLHEGFINAGQVAGLIRDVPTVSDVIKEMADEADTAIKRMKGLLQ